MRRLRRRKKGVAFPLVVTRYWLDFAGCQIPNWPWIAIGADRCTFVPFSTAILCAQNRYRPARVLGKELVSTNPANHDQGLTLRQATLIAGFGYLLGPVTYAEFSIYPKLVIPGNIEQTVQNIAVHRESLLPQYSAT
jgi:hypothetical protein